MIKIEGIKGVRLLGEMVAIEIIIPKPYEVPAVDHLGNEIEGKFKTEFPIPTCGKVAQLGRDIKHESTSIGFTVGDKVLLPSGSYVKLEDPRIVAGELTEHDKESTGYIMTHYKNIAVVYT